MEIELRDWQKAAYEQFKNSGYKGILKVGTGKGKTVFGIYCIQNFLKENPNFRTCIVVPTINLMFQWKKEIIKFLGIEESEVGFYYGQKKDSSGKIVILVVNSAVKNSNLEKLHLESPFNFMIADECHHYGANLFSKIFNFSVKYSLGLSATPEREKDKEGTEKIIKGIGLKVYELNHLDDPKAIPPFVIWSILVDLTEEEKSKYEENSIKIVKLNNFFLKKFGISPEDEDYAKKIKKLAEKNNPAARKLLSLWSKQADIKYQAENKVAPVKELVDMEKHSKIIIFNERIAFAKKLYEELTKEFNLNLFLIHSNLTKKEVMETLEKFRDVDKGILIAPRLIDEGYDVPDASVAIVASFTRSARQMIQRDGRILRKTPDKKLATRYSLIIKDIEEEKYFEVLRNAYMSSKALEGAWLEFDQSNNSFSESHQFKDDFINFGEIKKYHKDQFKDWLIKNLDYYELHIQKLDIKEIEKRLEFFSRFIDIIDILSQDYPNRWKNLSAKLKRIVSKKVKYVHQTSHEERELLKNGLRVIHSRIILPDNIFQAIMRFIENEKFELDDMTKEYINNLTEGERPDVWPERLYDFLKDVMRHKIDSS